MLHFSNQEGLFVINCSLAALCQTTRICMSHVASGRDRWCAALLNPNQNSYRLLKFVSDLVSIFDTG